MVVAGITGGGATGSAGGVGAGHAQPVVAGASGAGGLDVGGLSAGVATGVAQSHTAIGSRGGFGWFVAAAAAV